MSAGRKEGREAVLGRVRRALEAGRGESRSAQARGSEAAAVAGLGESVRGYRVAGESGPGETLSRLLERLHDYGVRTHRAQAEEVPALVASILAGRGVARLVAPRDLPEEWAVDGFEWVRDEGLSDADIAGSDGVVTGCALAVAETGTIALDGGRSQGRRALSLLPDYHLCVVREEQVVELVPEAVRLLEDSARRGRPITFISGPSATSDIELSRVEGVHGPRTLEVILVGGSA